MIEENDKKVDDEIINKGYEYAKGVEIIEKRLEEHMVPVREDVTLLVKTRARNVADD